MEQNIKPFKRFIFFIRSKIFILCFQIAVLFFIVGFVGGRYTLLKGVIPANPEIRGSLVRLGNYNFINPLLWCEIIGNREVIPEYKPMKEYMSQVIDEQIAQGKIKTASIFLSTLNTGRWFGVNENEQFSPASMLKVTIMISFFKLQEEIPDIMKKTIVYDGSFDDDAIENIKNNNPLIVGKSYTIEELIENMIIDSGNNARRLLKTYLFERDQQYLNQVYTDLRLSDPPANGGDYMSPREYSSIFRVLYNATYLSRGSSEKALQILSKASFADGIVAGVPSGTTVSHKFGERKFVNSDGSSVSELHDCGIVYYPGHPYFLCIMTKGEDEKVLASVVAKISSEAYGQIGTYFKKFDSNTSVAR
ncbi:MAG: serine hydrolase [Candidatus Magasanikbacteria bacterium]|nr:serine hydrolase [Candidatus Magasanikbacteria bacterium]